MKIHGERVLNNWYVLVHTLILCIIYIIDDLEASSHKMERTKVWLHQILCGIIFGK